MQANDVYSLMGHKIRGIYIDERTEADITFMKYLAKILDFA